MKNAARFFTAVLLVSTLSGCVTLSGTYVVTATDADSRDLAPNVQVTAEGSGVYTARNALCSARPGAIIRIKDIKTGQELSSESPYTCKSR
ncbi:hypothetical protein [Stenotrophomonas sp.]|uniref:hypothetical protein n=1 Tax=Stenotrophomonas sp. TaxID=69392 RepID=UPI0028A91B81|nr:hypothetical protein [Stenotrophomonas sp.]